MKQSIQRISMLLVLLTSCLLSHAQVVISPNFQQSEVFLFDQLFQVNVINTTNDNINGFLSIEIEEANGTQVLSLTSDNLSIPATSMLRSPDINWQNNLNLGQTPIAIALGETGRLAFGSYVFCYRFIATPDARTLGVNCQEKNIQPIGLPALVSPHDGENLKTNFPLLTWRPPLPLADINVSYNLVLTELRPGQTYAQAIAANFPIIRRKNIRQLALAYPNDAYPLNKDKQYVWQVTAYYNSTEIGKTDIWSFQFKDEKTKNNSTTQTYRFLKKQLDGAKYSFEDVLYFAFENRYQETQLSYKIFRHYEDLNRTVSGLPVVNLNQTQNIQKISLDLSNNSGMNSGEYLLEAEDKYGNKFYLPFTYKKSAI